MKSNKLKVVILAIILVCMLVLVQQSSAESLPLGVRGGKGLRFWTEKTQNPQLVKMIVTFQPSTRAASSGLRPGEGSWTNRGMKSGEPTRLEYFVRESDANKIFDYLRSPSDYYVFECFDTGKGYLQVTKSYPKSGRKD
jgi:hypothetical protein